MATQSLPMPGLGVETHGAESDRPGRRGSSLYLRVVAVNTTVMLAAVVALALTPVTVSSPIAARQGLILLLGVVVLGLANAALLRLTFRGLAALSQRMETLDLLRPQDRLPEVGGREAQGVIAGFNTMLDRLSAERRDSTQRAVVAIEHERRRIGLELHDEIGQRLTGILLQLDRIHEDAAPDLQGRAAAVIEQVRAALDEIGALAWQLRPSVLDDLGLISALDSLTGTFEDRRGSAVTALLPDALPVMPGDVQLCIYRIAQEAMTNAMRHAHATAIQLKLTTESEVLALSVTDDGCGLASEVTERSGIRGMRERALSIEGALHVSSYPGVGTCVRLEIPRRSWAQ